MTTVGEGKVSRREPPRHQVSSPTTGTQNHQTTQQPHQEAWKKHATATHWCCGVCCLVARRCLRCTHSVWCRVVLSDALIVLRAARSSQGTTCAPPTICRTSLRATAFCSTALASAITYPHTATQESPPVLFRELSRNDVHCHGLLLSVPATPTPEPQQRQQPTTNHHHHHHPSLPPSLPHPHTQCHGPVGFARVYSA